MSIIRLIDGTYELGSGELCLLFDKVNGTPAPGDGILLFESVWTISELTMSANEEKHKLIATTYINIMDNLDEQIIDLRGKEIVCGYSWEAYKLLASQDKIKYFKAVVDLYPFTPISVFIKEHIQLTIAMFPIDDADTGGLSKLGGLPTAPANLSYPMDKNGNCTLFIGQIHLGEFNQWFDSTRELAGRGILYFFGSIRVSHNTYYSFDEICVRYSEETKDLTEISLPDDIKEYGVFEEKNITAVEEISLPPLSSTIVEQENWDDEKPSLYRRLEMLTEVYNYFDPPQGNYFDCIRLLGFPQPVHHCVQSETVQKNLRQGWYDPDKTHNEKPIEMTPDRVAEILEWRHLFSFPAELFRKMSAFRGQFNEHMDGIFYVMVKDTDLKKMIFDNTESVYQST
jgi:uncharacterized protein YwqG